MMFVMFAVFVFFFFFVGGGAGLGHTGFQKRLEVRGLGFRV